MKDRFVLEIEFDRLPGVTAKEVSDVVEVLQQTLKTSPVDISLLALVEILSEVVTDYTFTYVEGDDADL